MGVQHGRRDVPVTEQFLDGPDVMATLQQMGGKRMAHGVAARNMVRTSPIGWPSTSR
jgi:hypothetical protein